MRSYAEVATSAVREMLAQLIESRSTEDYRAMMTRLGEELGTLASHKLRASDRIMLVCTNEDADFLAKGVLRGLEQVGCTHITLACFWNARQRTESLDVAPIVRQYIEPVHEDSINVFVVVKSIISSACVIRTNISELVYDLEPERVLILAPVVLGGPNKIWKQSSILRLPKSLNTCGLPKMTRRKMTVPSFRELGEVCTNC